jgi:hypothetical protein
LISWTTTARDEEILRAELDEHIAMPVQALVEYWNQSII